MTETTSDDHDDLVIALCRALSLYAWAEGKRFNSEGYPEYRIKNFAAGENDRFAPYIVSLSKDGTLRFAVSKPVKKGKKDHD